MISNSVDNSNAGSDVNSNPNSNSNSSSNSNNSWAEKCSRLKQQFSPFNGSGEASNEPMTKSSSLIEFNNPHLSIFIESMNVCAFILSSEGEILHTNVCASQLLASTKNQLVGYNLTHFLCGEYKSEYVTLFETCNASPLDAVNHGAKEVQFNCADGHVADVDLSISTFKRQDKGTYLIAILHDLTVQKTKQKKLQRLANIDTLTELFNRRAFQEKYAVMWQSCVEEHVPLCMLMIDVDYFKKFNDEHGHIKGDECLHRIGKALTACLPTPDSIVSRYGGEEFVLVLPRNAYNMAHIVAVRVQRAIEQLTFEDIGLSNNVGVTVSIGVAQASPRHTGVKEDLIQAADKALLKAKRQGRNTIVRGHL